MKIFIADRAVHGPDVLVVTPQPVGDLVRAHKLTPIPHEALGRYPKFDWGTGTKTGTLLLAGSMLYHVFGPLSIVYAPFWAEELALMPNDGWAIEEGRMRGWWKMTLQHKETT